MNIEFSKPKNFPYDRIIYFDNRIAMMYGTYKKAKYKSLGMRWMIGESKLGYPNIFGKSMWMVVPKKIALYTLEGILENDSGNIKIEIEEFKNIIQDLKKQIDKSDT